MVHLLEKQEKIPQNLIYMCPLKFPPIKRHWQVKPLQKVCYFEIKYNQACEQLLAIWMFTTFFLKSMEHRGTCGQSNSFFPGLKERIVNILKGQLEKNAKFTFWWLYNKKKE